MAALHMEIPKVDDSLDPEEGAVELLTSRREESSDDQPASAPSMRKCRALWLTTFVVLGGLLVVAAYTHLRGARGQVAAAVEDVEQLQFLDMAARTCAGTVGIEGLGQTALINTKPEAEGTAARQIEVQGNTLIAHMGGRAYFGDQCVENKYDNNFYAAFPLLGNTLRYTIDLAGAGCGCNAAVYLVAMKQNNDVSTCGDYYCDANSVCGVQCTEVDIQEANMYAWRSTLHTADDRGGQGVGYGGTGALQSSWEDGQYGPGGNCIDTNEPFQVAVSFPVTADNTLQGMQVTLSQDGSPCSLTKRISSYQAPGRDGIPEVSKALAEGMTPVVSFWSDDSMGWLDGKGPNGGACDVDQADQCPDSVKVYGFSVEKGVHGTEPSTPAPIQAASKAAKDPIHQDGSASHPNSVNVIMSVPKADDPDWETHPGKDTFAFKDAHYMSAADIAVCKAYAFANHVETFVVWRGDCYFRSQSGPECKGHLHDSSEATTYILRSSLAPVASVPEKQAQAPSQPQTETRRFPSTTYRFPVAQAADASPSIDSAEALPPFITPSEATSTQAPMQVPAIDASMSIPTSQPMSAAAISGAATQGTDQQATTQAPAIDASMSIPSVQPASTAAISGVAEIPGWAQYMDENGKVTYWNDQKGYWEQAVDVNGNVYYYNEPTGQTAWSLPPL